jgi:hypothetical protein
MVGSDLMLFKDGIGCTELEESRFEKSLNYSIQSIFSDLLLLRLFFRALLVLQLLFLLVRRVLPL